MPQRILVHDYSGHPFQPQLSRRLAARGHEVLHVYSQSVLIPQGALSRSDNDSERLGFAGIRLPGVIDKQAYIHRYFQEVTYGRLLGEKIKAFRPDVVISSSTPLDAQKAAIKATKGVGGRFVFWLQDIQGIAIERLLGARFNGIGRILGRYYTAMEKRLLRGSDAVVAITEDFGSTLETWGVDPQAVHVIPNWASMEELPARPRANDWARSHNLVNKFCFLYSGTLGLKHSAELFVRLALAYRDQPDIAIVVVSDGAKAEWLKQQKLKLGLEALQIFPFQPYADVPDVMGSADVLVAILDADASVFSVPSKVLSYHCAGRPILLAVPPQNLAARIVTGAQTGLVVGPNDAEGFLQAAEELRSSPFLRLRFAENALQYARTTFDIDRISDRFENLFQSLVDRGPSHSGLDDEEVAHERA